MSDRAEVLARHVSPDGELVWRVEREEEANGRIVISFGFEGGPWHLHPESFEAHGRSPEQIASDVTNNLLHDRYVVVTEIRPAGEKEVRLLATIEYELEFSGTYAELRFRFWNGRPVDRAELLEGTVAHTPLEVIWRAKS
jgi:hypothetical protein